jgi:hypothetical protein
MVERRNMINDYLRGRAFIESFRGSLIQEGFWVWAFLNHFVSILSFSLLFFFGVPLFVPFVDLTVFSFSRWLPWAFLGFFGLLVVLYGVLDSNFKLCDFCYQWTHQGGDWETKWSVPWFDIWWIIDLVRFEFESWIFRFLPLSLLYLENRVFLSRGV